VASLERKKCVAAALFFSSFTSLQKIKKENTWQEMQGELKDGGDAPPSFVMLSDGRRHLSAVFFMDDRCRTELALPLVFLPPKHFTGGLMLVFFGERSSGKSILNSSQCADKFHFILLVMGR
jgi:hypothetical protein